MAEAVFIGDGKVKDDIERSAHVVALSPVMTDTLTLVSTIAPMPLKSEYST